MNETGQSTGNRAMPVAVEVLQNTKVIKLTKDRLCKKWKLDTCTPMWWNTKTRQNRKQL
jgi:hypothetical protein